MRKLFMTGALALAMTAGVANAADIFVRFGPPPPRREIIVARPGPGYAYVPGYYRFDRGRYRWVRGYWMRPPRYRTHWVPGYWQPRYRSHVWVEGYWR